MVSGGSNGSNWSDGLATKLGLGAAIAISLALIFWGIYYGLSEETAYEQSAGDAHAEHARHGCYVIPKSDTKTTAIKQPDSRPCTPSEKGEKENDNRRDYVDLVAQRSSALWAKIMGIAALVGMGLSLLGVVLVAITFRETRKGNEIAVLADRPWLGFKPGPNGHLEIKGDTLGYHISIPTKNYGVRPALAVRGRITAVLDCEGLIDIEKTLAAMRLDDLNPKNFITIFPGQVEDVHVTGMSEIGGLECAETQFVISIEYADPALKQPLVTAEAFDIHSHDATICKRDGDVTKLLFHGQPNTNQMARFDLHKIREIDSLVT
jgi:hypothetical protein